MTNAAYDIAEFKAVGDGPKGLFAALVSVFNNIDRNGDRVLPGAFKKSLERWRASKQPIPVIWSHERNNPDSYIGEVDPEDIRETKDGLVVAGKLDIESNPTAARVYDLLLKNRVKQWSFTYHVNEERLAKDLARDLVELDLFEVGPTLIGANAEARTLAMKSADEEAPMETVQGEAALEPLVSEALAGFEGKVDELIESKIGRAISSKTEAKIRAALAALEEILSSPREEVLEQASSPPETPGENELLKLGLTQAGVFLAERNRS